MKGRGAEGEEDGPGGTVRCEVDGVGRDILGSYKCVGIGSSAIVALVLVVRSAVRKA